MCGRYTLTAPESALARLFGVESWPAGTTPRYNLAPSQDAAIVAAGRPGESWRAGPARWGLIPPWAEDAAIGYKMINARLESVAQKPAFKDAFRRRRCLVPADGFYEWQDRGKARGGKQPWRIRRSDAAPFAFAGLWQRWRPPEGAPVISFTIVTGPAHDAIAPLHPRMPVMLPPAWFAAWLDGPCEAVGGDAPALADFAGAMPADVLAYEPVSKAMNSPANDQPSLVEPVALEGEDSPGEMR